MENERNAVSVDSITAKISDSVSMLRGVINQMSSQLEIKDKEIARLKEKYEPSGGEK